MADGWADAPIEFSRISRSGTRAGCLTLVIDERSEAEVATMYVLSERSDLSQAISDLQNREGTSRDDIGFWEAPARFAERALKRHPQACQRIHVWALEKGFDAVIWTALPPRFKDEVRVSFTPAAALDYLNGLPALTKKRALDYIHNAPAQTMTPFRRLLQTTGCAQEPDTRIT